MLDLSTKLDKMVVRATSPDRNVLARLRNHGSVTIGFRWGWYPRYERRELEDQLGRALNTVWQTYLTALRNELNAAGAEIVDGARHWDSHQRRFHAELDKLVFQGTSPLQSIKVSSVARTRFEFTIKPDALKALNEERFAAEVDGALREWLTSCVRQTDELNDRFYDLNRPPTTIITAQRTHINTTENRVTS